MTARHTLTSAGDLMAELDRKLIINGGTKITHRQSEPYAEMLVTRGYLFLLPVKRRAGKVGHPDSSAAAVWARNIDKFALVTGYALTAGTWVPRSWVVDRKTLYDTEAPADRYFGARLDRHEAIQFWLTTYLVERYPGPASLIMAMGAEEEPGIPNE
jgi:hypothetical protein